MKLFCRVLLHTVLCAGTIFSASQSVAARLNVVLIVADDLGWGELGCYGQQKILTPNIDRLAASGQRFTQFYSGAPVCAPSRCVLMTGLHLGHAEIRGNKERLNNCLPAPARLGFVPFSSSSAEENL